MLASSVSWLPYQPHPEVWIAIGAILALGIFAVRVIGPIAVPNSTNNQSPTDAQTIVTRSQKIFFFTALVILWISADWPIHDISEEYLYSVHMFQHLLISFVVPPLLLLAVPQWLARLIVLEDSRFSKTMRRLCHPVVAGVAFNIVQAFAHWGVLVDLSVRNGEFHYFMHLLVFATALFMWMPVLGPLRELHLTEPAKMVYLFTMSIVPTVPAAWLTFAEGIVYPIYGHDVRLWGISATADQQAAGAIMKVLGGGLLWLLIAIRFFRWCAVQRREDAHQVELRHQNTSSSHASNTSPATDATPAGVGSNS